ncbi:MAG TPA: hypothetical protein VKT82_07085 [Ktedonobacterales bacterium]|nr:hypothetical protein [Ktedonobacterales bacterium]
MPANTQHIIVSQTIHLAAPSRQVFPLFEPLGEKAWAAGWEPHILYPADGTAEAGAIFTTSHPPEGESIWAMTAHDPAALHLAYLRVTPGVQVAFIEVRCEDLHDGTTRATVSYTFTGLSAAGNEKLTQLATHHQQDIATWEQAINFYLAHGHALPQHHQGLDPERRAVL